MLTRSSTFVVRIIAPAARIANATAKTSDCEYEHKSIKICNLSKEKILTTKYWEPFELIIKGQKSQRKKTGEAKLESESKKKNTENWGMPTQWTTLLSFV